MKFPNAYDGIKKLFAAEILEIISVITGVVAGVAGLFAYGADQTSHPDVAENAAMIAVIFGIITGVLLIAASIINFIGLNNAAKDEPEFKNAVMAVIVSIVLSVVGVILPESAKAITAVLDTATTAISVYVSYTVVKGICNLAERLNDKALVEEGKKIITYIVIAAVLGVVSDIIQTLWIKDPRANLNIILSIAIIAFGLFRGIAYIIYLAKAKKMLQNA